MRGGDRSRANRPELLYRNIAGTETDPRLAAIIEKALTFMENTEPEEWTKSQWTLLNKIWTENKQNNRVISKTSKMSISDLKSSLAGAPLISKP